MSTTYYALFHCLASCCANLLVGGAGADRSKHAWHQVYRALEHGTAKKSCTDQALLKRFPKEIEDFANMFVIMQEKRHSADYNPRERFYKSSVNQDIADATDVVKRFGACTIKDRRAFAALVLFKRRK